MADHSLYHRRIVQKCIFLKQGRSADDARIWATMGSKRDWMAAVVCKFAGETSDRVEGGIGFARGSQGDAVFREFE